MNVHGMRIWTAALRSGLYEQARGKLGRIDRRSGKRRYCCLGVAEIKAGTEVYDPLPVAPDTLRFGSLGEVNRLTLNGMELLGSSRKSPMADMHSIMNPVSHAPFGAVEYTVMNDLWHLSFPQIADMADYFGVM